MIFERDSDGSAAKLHRRSILAMAAGAASIALGGCHRAVWPPQSSEAPRPLRAIAFDALAVFNSASVVARCEQAFPARGEQLDLDEALRER